MREKSEDKSDESESPEERTPMTKTTRISGLDHVVAWDESERRHVYVDGGDLVFKYKGFSAFAEYFKRERKPEIGPSFHSDGYHLQAGYFVVRDRFEVAFRWASWDPTDEIADNDRTELGGALNYYIHRHRLKVQGDFRQLEDKGRSETGYELRLQAQFQF